MRRLRLKSLLEADKFNYLIVYKNRDKENLENILSGERLERYHQANRPITKYKLLSGSYFIYNCLKGLGFSEETCQEAFSTKSSYLINLPEGRICYSNSGDYHVLTYSFVDETGVDIEEYRDRSEMTYRKFLSLSEESKGDYKLLFYQKWLEKEIIFKQKQAKDIHYFTLEGYLIGYAFTTPKKVKFVQLLDLTTGGFVEMSLSDKAMEK